MCVFVLSTFAKSLFCECPLLWKALTLRFPGWATTTGVPHTRQGSTGLLFSPFFFLFSLFPQVFIFFLNQDNTHFSPSLCTSPSSCDSWQVTYHGFPSTLREDSSKWKTKLSEASLQALIVSSCHSFYPPFSSVRTVRVNEGKTAELWVSAFFLFMSYHLSRRQQA